MGGECPCLGFPGETPSAPLKALTLGFLGSFASLQTCLQMSRVGVRGPQRPCELGKGPGLQEDMEVH